MRNLNKAVLALIIMSCGISSCAAAQKKPNILFIVCDDLNTHVATSGYDDIKTPTLTSFAKGAMTFNRAFCQYPVCGPSRASFLSGLYPQSTGVLDNKADIRNTRPGTITMPQHFKENGYWTAGVGKVFHGKLDHGQVAWNQFQKFSNDELPVVTAARKKFEAENGSVEDRKNRKKWKDILKKTRGRSYGQSTPGYGPTGLTDAQHKDGKNVRQVAKWLKDKSYGDKPFFIALGIQKPHVPFLAPQKYFDMYPKDKIKFYRDRPNLWDTLPKTAMVKRYKAFGFELGKENVPLRQSYMQAYHACVSFIDAQFAVVFDQLKKQGLWDDTIIVLTSDHGYHLGDHFLWGKVTLFDIGAKVPFIVRVPGMTKAASRSEAMVELLDIYPTLSELAGLKAPAHLQGTSLVPLLRDPSHKGSKEYAYSVVTRGNKLGYAVRNQKWRYGKWPDGEELYDLKKDPHERENLAKDPKFAPQLKKLRTVLKGKQTQALSRRKK